MHEVSSDNASHMLGFKAMVSAYGISEEDLCLLTSVFFHLYCFVFSCCRLTSHINPSGVGFRLNTYKQNYSSDLLSQLITCQSKWLALSL